VKAKWRTILEGSRQEAILAVSLYNQPVEGRRLEAFFVHMHLAWLYLFHARFRRDGMDYHYRRPDGRLLRVDGEPKTWDLTECLSHGWRERNDPVRRNLEMTIALRHKIEHRYEEAIAHYTAGYAQALLVNYEEELVASFGRMYSLAGQLRFPVFVSCMTPDGIAALTASAGKLPTSVKSFIARFEADLDPAIRADYHYDLRIYLVPQLGSKTDADMALRFVREEELTEEQRDALVALGRTGRVLVRERIRPVINQNYLKATQAALMVERRIPFRFSVWSGFMFAWKNLGIRPTAAGDVLPFL
jgi:hypothetical protein